MKYDQPTAKPTRKVFAGGIGGLSGASLATVAMAVVRVWNAELYEVLTEDPQLVLAVGGIFTAVIGMLSAYMTKETV